jgi:hypothetical protein
MSNWLTVRTFLAIFLAAFGFGFMFSEAHTRLMFGAVFVALGLTFLCRLALAARER